MTASEILEHICEGKAGITLRTIVDTSHDNEIEQEPIYEHVSQASVHIRLDAQHVIADLTFDDDETFEEFTDALKEMNEQELPADKKNAELLNVVVLSPEYMDVDTVEYASAFLGLYTTDDDELVVTLILDRANFGAFSLDLNELADADAAEAEEELEGEEM